MIELAVVSGTGGTGKTSLTACFAVLAERPVVADCDVDAADLHLVLQPTVDEREAFSGRSIASVEAGRCTECGRCVEVCRFGALVRKPRGAVPGAGDWGDAEQVDGDELLVDALACTGCGLCTRVCPAGALAMEPVVNGELYVSRTRVGPMAHARLGVAEDTSGKLVTRVRERARRLAEERGHDLVLIDGPPGIGCPVIASIAGVDLVVIVTEPTVAGRHDLERVVRLAAHFRRRFAVCVNKWDLNPELADRLTQEAKDAGAVAVGRVRYDGAVTAAQRAGRALVEYSRVGAAGDVTAVWASLSTALQALAREDERSERTA
jgi:MinD superfamily P-loop ATPase